MSMEDVKAVGIDALERALLGDQQEDMEDVKAVGIDALERGLLGDQNEKEDCDQAMATACGILRREAQDDFFWAETAQCATKAVVSLACDHSSRAASAIAATQVTAAFCEILRCASQGDS